MNILLIDKNIKKYQPQVKWEMLDEELSISKFNKVYIFVDNATQVNHICHEYPNAIFVSEKDLNISNPNFIVKKLVTILDDEYDFKRKIIKHDYIAEYLLGRRA